MSPAHRGNQRDLGTLTDILVVADEALINRDPARCKSFREVRIGDPDGREKISNRRPGWQIDLDDVLPGGFPEASE